VNILSNHGREILLFQLASYGSIDTTIVFSHLPSLELALQRWGSVGFFDTTYPDVQYNKMKLTVLHVHPSKGTSGISHTPDCSVALLTDSVTVARRKL
jgi:hypothetical protein